MNTGQIIKSRTTERFTTIPNEILRRTDLSLKAKGLIAFLLSLPGDWVLYKTTLPNYCTDGKASIDTAWVELEDAGFIQSFKIIDKQGKLRGWNHLVYDQPVLIPITEKTSKQPLLKEKPKSAVITEQPQKFFR